MPRSAYDDPVPTPALLARHAARFDRCWPLVRVESVQLKAGATGDCACALVQLGGLTPADVRVEIMPAGSGGGTTADAREVRRMFSSHALANGCFMFEVTLPHRDSAAPEEWLIHVHPSEALEEPRVEYRFAR